MFIFTNCRQHHGKIGNLRSLHRGCLYPLSQYTAPSPDPNPFVSLHFAPSSPYLWTRHCLSSPKFLMKICPQLFEYSLMLLNSQTISGKCKIYWWRYHYTTVYYVHRSDDELLGLQIEINGTVVVAVGRGSTFLFTRPTSKVTQP